MDNMQQVEGYDPYSQNSFGDRQDSSGVYLKDRLKMIIEKIRYYAVRILPYIGRFITFLFFYAKKIVVSGIKIALNQLRF